MINPIQDVIKNGSLFVDENGRTTIEKINVNYEMDAVFIQPALQTEEEKEYYFGEKGLVRCWYYDICTKDWDINSRRIVTTYLNECISMIQVLCRDGRVNLNVSMRSCDAYNKMSVNQDALNELANMLLSFFHSSCFKINVNIGSLHLYVSDILNFKHGNCVRSDYSAIVFKDKSLVGFNVNSCALQGKCIRKERDIPSGSNMELCSGSHAEILAMFEAAKVTKLHNGVIYAKHSPCATCASYAYHMGIKEFYYLVEGDDEAGKLGLKVLEENNIKYGVFK